MEMGERRVVVVEGATRVRIVDGENRAASTLGAHPTRRLRWNPMMGSADQLGDDAVVEEVGRVHEATVRQPFGIR